MSMSLPRVLRFHSLPWPLSWLSFIPSCIFPNFAARTCFENFTNAISHHRAAMADDTDKTAATQRKDKFCESIHGYVASSFLTIAPLTSARSVFAHSRYSDFTIRCGARSWKVHKVIISSVSEYFEKACSGEFKVGMPPMRGQVRHRC